MSGIILVDTRRDNDSVAVYGNGLAVAHLETLSGQGAGDVVPRTQLLPARGLSFDGGDDNDNKARRSRPFWCNRLAIGAATWASTCNGSGNIFQWGGIGIHTGGLPANFVRLETQPHQPRRTASDGHSNCPCARTHHPWACCSD
jgi:hypothetical protein